MNNKRKMKKKKRKILQLLIKINISLKKKSWIEAVQEQKAIRKNFHEVPEASGLVSDQVFAFNHSLSYSFQNIFLLSFHEFFCTNCHSFSGRGCLLTHCIC
jgi:hypothetical protein